MTRAAKSKRRHPDHAHKEQRPSPDNEQIAKQLEDLLTPAITAQQAYDRQ